MKVAVLRTLPDPERRSMDLYQQELVSSLAPLLRSDESVTVFPDPLENGKWHADLQSPWGKWRRYYQQYLSYGQKLGSLQADIYHIVDQAYAHLIPFLKGKKVVVTFHDALLANLEAGKIPVVTRPWLTIYALRYGLRQLPAARGIIVVSDFVKRELLRYCPLPEDHVTTIYEGVGPHFFKTISAEERTAFRRKWNLEDQTVVLLTGRTLPHKNMEGTLSILQRIVERHSSTLIVKVGTPFTAFQEQEIDRLGLRPKIKYLGCLTSTELPLVYRASDVLVFLSWYEGFGFPALEALASGVPAVVSNRGSLPEIVGDAALIVDPENQEKAAEVILKVMTDSALRNSLIEKGKQRAARFSWDETARKTLELYRVMCHLP